MMVYLRALLSISVLVAALGAVGCAQEPAEEPETSEPAAASAGAGDARGEGGAAGPAAFSDDFESGDTEAWAAGAGFRDGFETGDSDAWREGDGSDAAARRTAETEDDGDEPPGD